MNCAERNRANMNWNTAGMRGFVPSTTGCPPSLHDIRFGRAACRALPKPRMPAVFQWNAFARWRLAHAITLAQVSIFTKSSPMLAITPQYGVNAPPEAAAFFGARHATTHSVRLVACGGALLSARPKRISWSDGERSTMLDTRAAMRTLG